LADHYCSTAHISKTH